MSKTVWIIEVNYINPDNGDYTTYVYNEAYNNSSAANTKAEEIERIEGDDTYCEVKEIPVK